MKILTVVCVRGLWTNWRTLVPTSNEWGTNQLAEEPREVAKDVKQLIRRNYRE